MTSVNKAIILGNLGKDPEIRNSQHGKKIAIFSLATNETWKDKNDGTSKTQVEWHKVVIYNEKLASFVETYLKKGMKIYVEGKMCAKKWLDKTGVEHIATEIILSNFDGKLVIASGGAGNNHIGGQDYPLTNNVTNNIDANNQYDDIDFPLDF